jgi:hypothetical protein
MSFMIKMEVYLDLQVWTKVPRSGGPQFTLQECHTNLLIVHVIPSICICQRGIQM